MSDEDVEIKDKNLLSLLREESDIRDARNRTNDRTVFSNGYAEGRVSGDNESTGSRDATAPGDVKRQGRKSKREETARESDRTFEAVQPGIRQINGSREYPTEDPSYDDRRNKTKINFQLKNPFNFKDTTKKPIKLFTQTEAKLEHDRLVDIYFRGSSLIDDMLEIVVKDHEPVSIWQLDETEAEMLAELHLARAQVNEESARSARQLLAIYDRLYVWILAMPRLKATHNHVQEHGGYLHGITFK
jgi:hypothetical protein